MITINKAIETLELEYRKREIPYDEDYINALQLGIEALKRFYKMRHGAAEPIYYLLPGETK